MAETVPEVIPGTAGPAFDYRAVLRQMLEQNASDLHLKVGCAPTLRVNGELKTLPMAPMRSDDMKTLADQIMPPKRQKEFGEMKEADFALGVPGIGRFRVNAYQQRGTIAYAFRIVPFQAHSIAELNLPGVLETIAAKPRGLVLVTGVTGSGKSTALAAMIQYINQREVGTDTASFAQALRRVLRQDPDILLVGEIRDLDTLDTAMKAADTGHLVFSTLHTTDATQTINRILSFYPPHQQAEVRFLLASALEAVISLRLVPRSDKPGRVPAAEILINTAAVRDNIRDMAKSLNIPELIADGTVQYGMQNFDQSLMNWYKKGVISYENALYYATNPSEFALRIQGVAGASETSWDNIQQDVAS